MPGKKNRRGQRGAVSRERHRVQCANKIRLSKDKKYDEQRSAWIKSESKKMQRNIRTYLKRKMYEVMWFEPDYPFKRVKTDSQEAMDEFIKMFQKFSLEYDIVLDVEAMSINGQPHTEFIEEVNSIRVVEGRGGTSSVMDVAATAAAMAQYLGSKFGHNKWSEKMSLSQHNQELPGMNKSKNSASTSTSNQTKETSMKNVLQASWLRCISDKISAVFSKSEQQPTTSSSSVPLSSLFDNSVVEANNAQAPFMGYRSGEEISNNGLEYNQVIPECNNKDIESEAISAPSGSAVAMSERQAPTDGQSEVSVQPSQFRMIMPTSKENFQKIPGSELFGSKASGKCDLNNNQADFIMPSTSSYGHQAQITAQQIAEPQILQPDSSGDRDINNSMKKEPVMGANVKTENDQLGLSVPSTSAIKSGQNNRNRHGRIPLEILQQKYKEDSDDSKSDTSDLSDISDLPGGIRLSDVDECRVSDLANLVGPMPYSAGVDESMISRFIGNIRKDIGRDEELAKAFERGAVLSDNDDNDNPPIPGSPLLDRVECKVSDLPSNLRQRCKEEDDDVDRKSDTSDLSDISDLPGSIPLSDQVGCKVSDLSSELRQRCIEEDDVDSKSDTSDLSDISDLPGSIPLTDQVGCKVPDLTNELIQRCIEKDDDDDSKSDTSDLSDISDLPGSIPLSDLDECNVSNLPNQLRQQCIQKDDDDDSKSDASDLSDISDLPGSIPLSDLDECNVSNLPNQLRPQCIKKDDDDESKSDTSDLSDISDLPGGIPFSDVDECRVSDLANLVGPMPYSAGVDESMISRFIGNIRKDIERDEDLAEVFESGAVLSDNDNPPTPQVISVMPDEISDVQLGSSANESENVFGVVQFNSSSDVQVNTLAIEGALLQKIKNDELKQSEASANEINNDMHQRSVILYAQQLKYFDLAALPKWGDESALPSFQHPQASADTGMIQDVTNNTVSSDAPRVHIIDNAAGIQIMDNVPGVSIIDNTARVSMVDNAAGIQIMDNAPEVSIMENTARVPNVDNAAGIPIVDNAPEVSPMDNAVRVPMIDNAAGIPIIDNAPRVSIMDNAIGVPIGDNAVREVGNTADEVTPQLECSTSTSSPSQGAPLPQLNNNADDIPSSNTTHMDPEVKPRRSILKSGARGERRARSDSSGSGVRFNHKVTCFAVSAPEDGSRSPRQSTSGTHAQGTIFRRMTTQKRRATNDIVSFTEDLADTSKDRENAPSKKPTPQARVLPKNTRGHNDASDSEQPSGKKLRIESQDCVKKPVVLRGLRKHLHSLVQRSKLKKRMALERGGSNKMMDCESGLLSNDMDVEVRPTTSKRRMDQMDISDAEPSGSKRRISMDVSVAGSSTSDMQMHVDDLEEKMDM